MFKDIAKIPFEGKEATLCQTDEFNRFKFIKENRSQELAEEANKHSRQIEGSINRYGYLITFIIVNEKWEVIDGQHRIAALRALNLPAYVVVIKGYNGRELQALNMANKNWTKGDFANYWAKKGKKDYVQLIEMHHELPVFGIGTMATLLSNADARKTEVFSEGQWEIKKNLATTRAHLMQLIELAEILPKLTNRSCAEAYLSVAAHAKFNFRRMKENIDSYGGKYWENHSSKEAFLMMFTSIYNHQRPVKNRVIFYNQKDVEIVAKGRMKKAA